MDVVTIQGLNHGGQFTSFISQYGQVIMDECHVISSLNQSRVNHKFNIYRIKDEQEFIHVEAQILIAVLVDIDSLLQEVDFFDNSSIQKIHYHLFSEIYDWAGSFRTVNIYKNEKVLNGLSVEY